jgi:hypothetical protein
MPGFYASPEMRVMNAAAVASLDAAVDYVDRAPIAKARGFPDPAPQALGGQTRQAALRFARHRRQSQHRSGLQPQALA